MEERGETLRNIRNWDSYDNPGVPSKFGWGGADTSWISVCLKDYLCVIVSTHFLEEQKEPTFLVTFFICVFTLSFP